MGGGGWKIFLCTRKYFGGLLQNHEINFDGYSVIRRNLSEATQNFSVGFLLCKGFFSLILHIDTGKGTAESWSQNKGSCISIEMVWDHCFCLQVR